MSSPIGGIKKSPAALPPAQLTVQYTDLESRETIPFNWQFTKAIEIAIIFARCLFNTYICIQYIHYTVCIELGVEKRKFDF